ncbi:MAG TPA: hypothetical protein DIU39_07040 [Flavobacteriales bacterium]|nr:hypothetical protein [Flavobacteriales bacterium]|tara:strand:- start:23835 stop:24611 length:777 start_codon:yes stop_codon:yes gene_type:complete
MAIITLTSDLGLKDYYVASVKGAILSQFPEAVIVDITHQIPAFDIIQTSIILKNCYNDFPQGTVHVIGVNSEKDRDVPHVAVKYNGHYFIGADNGVFSLIFDYEPEEIVEINFPDIPFTTFATKDIFVRAACMLAKGVEMKTLGVPKSQLEQKSMFRAISEGDLIKGMVIYVDHYGNVLTNVTQAMMEEVGKERPFTLYFRGGDYNISKINQYYHDVPEGERVALYNSSGFIEIAINKGNANKLFGIKQGDPIRIEFS